MMENTVLPIILLKKIVLLPCNELRLEFDNETSKNIIGLSSREYNKIYRRILEARTIRLFRGKACL